MILLAETNVPTLIALALLAAVVGMMLFRVQRYYARHPSSRPSLGASSQGDAAPRTRQRGAAADMVEWEVQMHDFARQVSGQLDSKMAALEHLTREADRAAARLEAAVAATRGQQPPAPPQAAPAVPVEIPGPPTSQADALRPTPSDDRPAGDVPKEEDLSVARPSRQRRHEEVYTLADYGYDAAEIARRVNSPVGEIELILGLRDKR
jgi:hypothetical protein